MIPTVSQGFGGQLILFKGGQLEIVNRSLEAQASVSFPEYVGQLDVDPLVTDFFRSTYGGRSSWNPAGYANHRPLTFLSRGRLVEALEQIRGDSMLYVGGWDGSGIFFNKGGQFQTVKWKSGRGWEALSPSGTHLVEARDLALINHNGVVFGVGHHIRSETNQATNPWTKNLGWTFDYSTVGLLTNTEVRRTYRVFSIDEKGKKILGPVTRFLPNITVRSNLASCDLTSFQGDLYYANWIDVLRFPGGSGVPQMLYNDILRPVSRHFGPWPSGGFNSSGEKVGENRLLILEGDGKLYRLKVPGSGRNLLVNLTDVATDDGRPNDNFLARINSSTSEPGRPTILMPFDRELHAFVVTATSGYMHFTCAGDPSGVDGWVDRTQQLPLDLRAKDGCLYGFVDDVTQRLCTLQVSRSKFGVFGDLGGGQNCGGGFWLRTLDANRSWEEITRGNVGLPMRGLVPYQNLGPWSAVPSGENPEMFKCSDYAVLRYKLFDQFGRKVDVDVDFSRDAGITWSRATRFTDYTTGLPLGSGVDDLATASPPSGKEYTFYWDFVDDVGFNSGGPVLLRVRPRLVR